MFRESVRDRVLYNLVLFALLLIGASYLLGQLTAGQDVKIIKDLGLAATSIFGLFIAIFIGIGLVSKEVERRSIYALLAKPVTRGQFISGKYAGLVLTLAVNVAAMTIGLYLVLGYMGWAATAATRASWEAPATDPALLKAVFLIIDRADARDRDCALLFDVLEPDAVRSAHVRAVSSSGRFNEDLKNFDQVVDSRPTIWLARAAYHAASGLLRRSMSRPKSCTACR